MSQFPASRIALLEARMSQEIAEMIRRYGGEPYCVPAVREVGLDCSVQVSTFIDRLLARPEQIVVFYTGVGVEALFRVAEQIDRAADLLTGLQRVTVVCRGPKPAAVLRRRAIPIAASAAEPYTTQELLEALSPILSSEIPVTVIHYGERNTFLLQAVQDRGVALEELCLYEWLLPEDTTPLRLLVEEILAGHIDAVVFTSQIQARHLFRVATALLPPTELAQALQTKTLVASIGPTCTATLLELGVTPHVEPTHPKIGYLIKELVEYITTHTVA